MWCPILSSKEVLLNFCLRNDISAAETLPLVTRLCHKNVYKWYRDFKKGRERVDDFQRSGRPSTSIDDQNIYKIKEMVLGNRRLTIRELVDMVGISFRQIEFGAEISQFLRKKASRSSMWINAFWLSRRLHINYYWWWILDLCLRFRNNRLIKWISFKRWGQNKKTSPKLFSSIIVVLCITNSFQLTKLSIRYII